MSMPTLIRRLNPGEADLYRAVRLEALKESPDAFASTYESALERSAESWQQQADASASGPDRATFVVLNDDRPVGVAALYRNPEKVGEGEMIQVWVAPALRGSTVAADLLLTLFTWAASNGFQTIVAEVTSNNIRALRFYEKHGFVRNHPSAGEATANPVLVRRIAAAEEIP